MKIEDGFASEVVAEAVRKGADQAEVFVIASKNLAVEIKDQDVESLKSSQSFGYSLRVIRRGRLGFCYSTDYGEKDFVVRNALEVSAYPDEDSCLDFPETSVASAVDVYDPEVAAISEEEAIHRVMMMEKASYDTDARIRKVRKATGSFRTAEVQIVNSKAVHVHYLSTTCSAQIMAVAESEGEGQTGWEFDGSRFLRKVSFEETGRNAAERAVRLLGSRKINGFRGFVILDNAVAVDFLGIFASSLSADAVQKGKSLLAGKLKQKIVTEKINIVDSGLLPGCLGSVPADAEGVAAREKMPLREGVLETYLYNTYTARKGGTVSTGNAVRGQFSTLPSVGVTNFFLAASSAGDTVERDRMFRLIGKGLFIVDAMGVHTANPVSGDFSVGVTGVWVENGEPQYPVKEAVFSGNILDLFNKIEAVGDDLRFYGKVGAPSLVISGVDISA